MSAPVEPAIGGMTCAACADRVEKRPDERDGVTVTVDHATEKAGVSFCALFPGTAGDPGMTHPFELTIARTDGSAGIYLEVAAGVTAFILAGRYFEARSERRAGAALRALMESGAKDATVLRGGAEQPTPIADLAVSGVFVVTDSLRLRRFGRWTAAPAVRTGGTAVAGTGHGHITPGHRGSRGHSRDQVSHRRDPGR